MKYCDNCGNKLEATSNFCPNCGKNFQTTIVQETHNHNMECPSCGSNNIQVQMVPESKKMGCLTVFIYLFLALTLIGIPIMILLLLLKGKQTKTKKYYVCQNCGKTFTPFFPLKSTEWEKQKKWILPLVILIIIICLLLAISYSSDNKSENGTSFPYTITDGVETNKDVFEIGEEIYCKDTTVLVKEVKYTSKVENYVPNDGKKFVEVTVTLKNTSNDEKNYFLSNFRIINSTGEISGPFSKITAKDMDSVTKLVSNGTLTGIVRFEIPKDSRTSTLQYSCGYWIDETKIQVNTSK